MKRLFLRAVLGCAALIPTGCGKSPPPPPAAAAPADPKVQVAQLGQLVERYWAEIAAQTSWYSWGGADVSPWTQPAENIAPQSLADALAIERRYLAEVLAIPRTNLDARSRLTYDIFRRERAVAIEGFTYPQELLPVDPFDGMPQQFALMASASIPLGVSGAKDLEGWKARSSSFARWSKQAVANLRDGLRRGYIVPAVLVERTLPQLAMLGADTADNPFYRALRTASGNAAPRDSEDERARASAVSDVLKNEILPAFAALHDFLRNDYLPRARSSVGLSALPMGDAWYAYLLRRTTEGTMSAAQLHALGQSEVDHLHQRLQALLIEAGFTGDASAFFDRLRADPRYSFTEEASLLRAYDELRSQVESAVPSLFAVVPRAGAAIRVLEAYRAEPSVSYRPRAPNGMLPALLYVAPPRPDRPAVFLPAAYLREGVPGRHYQIELQRERGDLPRFRRFGAEPAFLDGWSLYAASLGADLGVYRDVETRFGALLAQLDCATGLVVDTGVHAKGWTRQQAVDYLRSQMPVDPTDALDRVDRVIAHPAAATACTVGFLKMQALRASAQQRQGAAFDVRAYHLEVIKDGAMPLDLLEAKIKAWLDAGMVAAPSVVK